MGVEKTEYWKGQQMQAMHEYDHPLVLSGGHGRERGVEEETKEVEERIAKARTMLATTATVL